MTRMTILVVLLIIGTVAYLNKDWIIEQFEGKGDLGVPRGEECRYNSLDDTNDCQLGLLCGVIPSAQPPGDIIAWAPPTWKCMTIQDCKDNGLFGGAVAGSKYCFAGV